MPKNFKIQIEGFVHDIDNSIIFQNSSQFGAKLGKKIK